MGEKQKVGCISVILNFYHINGLPDLTTSAAAKLLFSHHIPHSKLHTPVLTVLVLRNIKQDDKQVTCQSFL